ncbi:uncharacterized protein LOC124461169 [Drosophila willistoni]|uniref:uncharacterized protein LOC124461169 n=1 Tax=Drosophila willistoni TaxID=7260 RepID=UPI001F07EEAD|nr:uncharacterized protein LOC124461169 [Drosophila willistoni]
MDEQSHTFLYEQLCKLRHCLGNPNYDVSKSINYILSRPTLNNDSLHELVVLDNLRLRFEELQLTGDSRNKDLMGFRADLSMHLYRELAGIEPYENKRYVYLTLCYELLDAGEPDNMTEEETIEYRLKKIDSLNYQKTCRCFQKVKAS